MSISVSQRGGKKPENIDFEEAGIRQIKPINRLSKQFTIHLIGDN